MALRTKKVLCTSLGMTGTTQIMCLTGSTSALHTTRAPVYSSSHRTEIALRDMIHTRPFCEWKNISKFSQVLTLWQAQDSWTNATVGQSIWFHFCYKTSFKHKIMLWKYWLSILYESESVLQSSYCVPDLMRQLKTKCVTLHNDGFTSNPHWKFGLN